MVDEESAACNSIANCNCSVYSYHSVARFGSALHQKHWQRKHLHWAPEQRRALEAPSSASDNNNGRLALFVSGKHVGARTYTVCVGVPLVSCSRPPCERVWYNRLC